MTNALSIWSEIHRTFRYMRRRALEAVFRSRPSGITFMPLLIQIFAIVFPLNAQSQMLLGWSAGPNPNIYPSHNSPVYIPKHIELIESRPFDGMIINDDMGRNLMNMDLKNKSPWLVSPTTGAITYATASRFLAPLKGIFKVYHHNFAKVNMFMDWSPPLLSDAAGWKTVYESATNYAKAVRDTGLKGILVDNESYHRPSVPGRKDPLDYWQYQDHLVLAGRAPSVTPLANVVQLARQRGRELMQAFLSGYPDITVIVAHGPYQGCDGYRSLMGQYANDRYLSGAFAAGMVEGISGNGTIVDGGEEYDLRTSDEFNASRSWRKGLPAPGRGSIVDLDPKSKCPFMDAGIATGWSQKLSIAFGTFDRDRPSRSINHWTPITDVATFRKTLTNALRATDKYVWHYTSWQDWWGTETENALKPWIEAIKAARQDAGSRTTPLRN